MLADHGKSLWRNPSNGFDVRVQDSIWKSNTITGNEVALFIALGEPIYDPGLAEFLRLR